MKPIRFFGYNCEYAKDQPEYKTLPCQKDEDGTVTVCWQLSLKERISILFKGVLWHKIMTFNGRLQPQMLSVDKEPKKK